MRTIFRWSLPLALLIGVTASAQERVVERQPAQPGVRAPDRGAATNLRDRELAHCILNGNRNEVEISKFAIDKLQDPEVKQFAQKMIDDHSKAIQTFARFDPGFRSTVPTSFGAPDPNDRNAPRTDRPAAPADRPATERAADERPATTVQRQVPTSAEVSGVAKAGLDWQQIGDELAAQCLTSAKKELTAKQGAEFEKCFLGMQVAGHMHMLDELTVFQKHAGEELRGEIGKAISTTQQHLQMAKKLMDEKKDTPSGARTTADKDATTERDSTQP